jgi:hypothetical protein
MSQTLSVHDTEQAGELFHRIEKSNARLQINANANIVRNSYSYESAVPLETLKSVEPMKED